MRRLLTFLIAAVVPAEAPAAAGCSGAAGSGTDAIHDIVSADTDFTAFSWSIEEGVLTFGMTVPELVQPVPVNHDDIYKPYKEYEWGVFVDVDGRQSTGSRDALFEGADYVLSVSNFHGSTSLGYMTLEQMQQDVWKIHEGGATSVAFADIQADPTEPHFQLTGAIPGIGPHSRLMPMTWWLDPGSLFAYLDINPDCSFYDPDTVHRSGFEG